MTTPLLTILRKQGVRAPSDSTECVCALVDALVEHHESGKYRGPRLSTVQRERKRHLKAFRNGKWPSRVRSVLDKETFLVCLFSMPVCGSRAPANAGWGDFEMATVYDSIQERLTSEVEGSGEKVD